MDGITTSVARQWRTTTKYSHFMLAYVATKQQFLIDAPIIEDKVSEAVLAKLGIRVSEAERNAWRNSLGNAMSHVVRDSRIPDNSGIAIEYRKRAALSY